MRRSKKGFSMIEVVLLITILAVAIPPLVQLFSETAVTGAQAAILPTATMFANGLMEEIKSRKFDELGSKSASGNWSTAFGPDSGEAGNKTLFDDVDDFNRWTQVFGSPQQAYTASVSVSYVAATNLNQPLSIPSPVPNSWTPSYKQIRVTVSNPGLVNSLTLTTVVTEVQSL